MSRPSETPEERPDAQRPVDVSWLLDLRRRFVSVARRRVPEADVEDIVQDALRVVVEKHIQGPGSRLVEGAPPIAWSFTVLRNTIGNHYQRARVRQRVHVPLDTAVGAADDLPTPLEALESSDAVERIRRAIAELPPESENCSRYLLALIEGRSPAELAGEEGLEQSVLYRRVYRCRQMLKARLARLGVIA